jgi:hypothetical protein
MKREQRMTSTVTTSSTDSSTSETFYLRRTGQAFGPYPVEQLQILAAARQLKPNAEVSRTPVGPTFPARDVPWVFSDKSWLLALVLSICFGTLGVDRFYVGHVWLGLGKLCTFGGLGLWALVDVVLFALRAVEDSTGRPLR